MRASGEALAFELEVKATVFPDSRAEGTEEMIIEEVAPSGYADGTIFVARLKTVTGVRTGDTMAPWSLRESFPNAVTCRYVVLMFGGDVVAATAIQDV